ncbi:hypothetical protein WAE61_01875 [Comamonadaceae bacterium PP-2]
MSETAKTRLKFAAKWVGVLEPFMAVTDIRYYLCGLLVEKAEKGGAYIVATDGHTLAVVYDQNAVAPAQRTIISVSRDLISKASKNRYISGETAHVVLDGQRLSIATDFDVEQSIDEVYIQPGRAVIEGNFPVWQRVLPDFSSLERGVAEGALSFNAHYIARMSRVAKAHRCSMTGGVRFWRSPGGHITLIQHTAIEELVVAVMPMADGHLTDGKKLLMALVPDAGHLEKESA